MSHLRGHISKLLDDYKTKKASQFITNEILRAITRALPNEKEHSKFPTCAYYGDYACTCGASNFNACLKEIKEILK